MLPEGMTFADIHPLYMLGAGAAAGMLVALIARLFRRK